MRQYAITNRSLYGYKLNKSTFSDMALSWLGFFSNSITRNWFWHLLVHLRNSIPQLATVPRGQMIRAVLSPGSSLLVSTVWRKAMTWRRRPGLRKVKSSILGRRKPGFYNAPQAPLCRTGFVNPTISTGREKKRCRHNEKRLKESFYDSVELEDAN